MNRSSNVLQSIVWFALGTASACLWIGCGPAVPSDPAILAQLPDEVDYNYHIKPLLSDRCYACHGPDDNARKADLRLYTEAGAKKATLESGGHAIVPGSLRRSVLLQRISTDDPEEMMPPPESNLSLSAYEKALIARWIDQGAVWKPHWAFLAPEEPDVQEEAATDGARNPIDHFVRTRLEREGLTPAPEADKERLLRRVTFDLTGLPPTLDEIDAYLADDSPDAYEKVVDRLLASPAYGERMAMEWMDVARYADSHGYHADGERMMWPWRDWVIRSFNDNMPFDQFVTWQMAGDLLPNATHEQKLATAFHRNHPMTAEGGIIDEEYRVEYVIDRTNTTARAFLGLTMECARCHDHKFDPFSQKEYYQLAAFFNNVHELGMTGDDGNAGPLLMLLEDEERDRLADARTALKAQDARIDTRAEAVRTAGLPRQLQRAPATLSKALVAHYPLDRFDEETTPNRAHPSRPARVTGEPEVVSGRRDSAIRFDNDYDNLYLENQGLYERTTPFSVSVWIHPEARGAYAEILGNAHHKNTYWRGWELYLDSLNHVSARLIHARPHNLLHIRTQAEAPLNAWTHVALTYDGSSQAAGLRLFMDGQEAEVVVEQDNLYKSILPVDHQYQQTDRALRVARSYRAFGGDDGIFTGSLDDIRLYKRALTGVETAQLYGDDLLTTILAQAPDDRTPEQEALLLEHYLQHHDAAYQQLQAERTRLREEEQRLIAEAPEIMVMEEMETPRPMYVLDRGLYDQPRDRVEPGTPAMLGAFPDDLPRNRLGLAQWLLRPEHPLTARVTVNRYWQLYFGQGLVNTPQDFGNQGTLPSHPALLDWLATTFIESGWDVKALQRLIVTSATYRQSSKASPERLAHDPANVLLARGPRHRLPAEMIRDNALAASGLLVNHVGGASVKPYQPPGLWIEKGNFSAALLNYVPDQGEGLYRRSLYTFLRRTSPPPSMTVFDAPDRTNCIVRRQNTNTPLQALVLLNDPQYVEAARIMAERMQREGGASVEAQITHGFRLATGRLPTGDEVSLLRQLYQEERQKFKAVPASVDSLMTVGDYPADTRLDKTETAALAMVASLMLNHDDAYTKR